MFRFCRFAYDSHQKFVTQNLGYMGWKEPQKITHFNGFHVGFFDEFSWDFLCEKTSFFNQKTSFFLENLQVLLRATRKNPMILWQKIHKKVHFYDLKMTLFLMFWVIFFNKKKAIFFKICVLNFWRESYTCSISPQSMKNIEGHFW